MFSDDTQKTSRKKKNSDHVRLSQNNFSLATQQRFQLSCFFFQLVFNKIWCNDKDDE